MQRTIKQRYSHLTSCYVALGLQHISSIILFQLPNSWKTQN